MCRLIRVLVGWVHISEGTFSHVVAHLFPRDNHYENILDKFDPLKPNFYIVKLGCTGVFIIFAQKHKLWVLVRADSARRV